MDTTLLDLDRVPTLEELRAFFKENDWSAAVISDKEQWDQETTKSITGIKSIIDEFFEPHAREMGLPRSSKAYSNDNPLIALRNSTETLIASAVNGMLTDNPDVAAEVLEKFDLDDPDIDAKADELLDNAVKKMMEVMNYEALAGIITGAPAEEDFRNSTNNHAKQDFKRSYYSSRTSHPIVSYDELADGGDESFLPPDNTDEQFNKELRLEALKEFWKTLDDTDKTIILRRSDGWSYESIAEELGFKTHSAVLKRRKKIEELFIEFLKNNYK